MKNNFISLVLALSLLYQQSGLLYAAGEINLANYLNQAKSAIVQPDIFQPARLRYISYDSRNNDFKLLLDKGDAKLNDATQELFSYFLIGLAMPNDTFWVNLRPDASENIIDPLLEKTDIGKIFLEADLQLKKDTASLTSPQNPEGKSYWDKLYKKAGELFPAAGGSAFGGENITIPTITRPWIVPNEVIMRETEDSAYIYKATLKVMLEADYLIGRGGSRTAPTPDQYAFSDPRLKELNEYSSQLIRETIIPKLTREVNSSKRYAKLRQVYYSLVLARWFKQKYQGRFSKNGTVLSMWLPVFKNRPDTFQRTVPGIDSRDLTNLTSQEPCDKQTYFQAYQKSFKDGEYNLKETVAAPFGQNIRSYISGGINVEKLPVNKIYVGISSEKVTGALMSSGSPLTSFQQVILNAAAKVLSKGYVDEGILNVSKDKSPTVQHYINSNKKMDRDGLKTLVELTVEENRIIRRETARDLIDVWRSYFIEVVKKIADLPTETAYEIVCKVKEKPQGDYNSQQAYVDMVTKKIIQELQELTDEDAYISSIELFELSKAWMVFRNAGKDSKASASPVELVFWDGEIRKKRVLEYIRGDELEEGRLKDILRDNPSFMDGKSLPNIRFVFSDAGVLEGYIVISIGGNSAAINAVAGNTQWIETAVIIAGMQELADISPQVEFIELNSVSKNNPYQMEILKRLIAGNEPYIKQLVLPGVYRADIRTIIERYYEYVSEEVKNEEENLSVINKYSGSPLVLEEKERKAITEISNGVKNFLTENLRQLGYAKYAWIEKKLREEGLRKVAAWIYEYYLKKAAEADKFKGSAVSQETRLKLKQWQENKEALERMLAVDKLKNRIIKAVGKDAGDLGVNPDLIAVKNLDELIGFLKRYSVELSGNIKDRVEANVKLKSDMSALEDQRENGDVPNYAQKEKFKELEKEISSNSYHLGKISEAKKIVGKIIEELSKISKLTGASSSAVMRKKDWESWMGQVKEIIAGADSLLYADFKIKSGKMRSAEDVYGWLDEKLLQLQNKLKEERERLSAERDTVYSRANGNRVRYSKERINSLESIKQDIGKIPAPFKTMVRDARGNINAVFSSLMTWRALSVPIYGRPYKLHFVSAEDNMDFVLATLEMPVELYAFDNRKAVVVYASERTDRIRIALGGGDRVLGVLVLEKKARIITNVNGKTLDISKALIIAGISELLEVDTDRGPIIINNEYTSLNDDLLNWLNELLPGERLEKKDRLIRVEYYQAGDIVRNWQKKTGVLEILSSPYLAGDPPLLACQKEAIIDVLLAYGNIPGFIMFDKLKDIIEEKLKGNQKYADDEAIVELAKSLTSVESRDKKMEFLTSIIKEIKSKKASKDAQTKERNEFLLKVMKTYFFVTAVNMEMELNDKKDWLGRFFEEIEKGKYFRPEEETWLNKYVFKEGLGVKEHFLRNAIRNIEVTLGRDTGYELPEEKYKIISFSAGLVNIAANIFAGSSSALSAGDRLFLGKFNPSQKSSDFNPWDEYIVLSAQEEAAGFGPAGFTPGGIDLTDRFMRLKIERTGGFADMKLFLPQVQNAQNIDLDNEFRQIEAIASSGIVPNSRRILELFSACYGRGEFGQRLPQVISCLKASSAIQEKLAIDSDDDFRLCLLLPEIFSDGG